MLSLWFSKCVRKKKKVVEKEEEAESRISGLRSVANGRLPVSMGSGVAASRASVVACCGAGVSSSLPLVAGSWLSGRLLEDSRKARC